MTEFARRTDEELLAAAPGRPEAFGAFYRRHAEEVVGFFAVRVPEPELAADLMAETFAAALLAAPRVRAEEGGARAWLYAIARHKLVDSLRRGQVRSDARRTLRADPLVLEDPDLERIVELADAAREGSHALEFLEELPPDERAAIRGRVVEERSYGEMAAQLRCSEEVVRKRVSRGLRALRTRLEGTP